MGFEEYQKLDGQFKIGAILVLEEQTNKAKEYKGLSFPEIKQKVRKYDPSISDEEFRKAIKSASDWGVIRVSDVEKRGEENIIFYTFDRINSDIHYFDVLLEKIGFIKSTKEILVK